MCGIFFSLNRHALVSPGSDTNQLLNNRGPDSVGTRNVVISGNPSSSVDVVPSTAIHATFISTVLSLRGTALTKQPLIDRASESTLCWNGEAWSIAGHAVANNDSCAVLDALLAPATRGISNSDTDAIGHVVQVLSTVRGPYAFVFYDARNQLVFYGRDCLGRRSLLNKIDDSFVLSSVCDNTTGENWAEVEADGVYVLDLKRSSTSSLPSATLIPHRRPSDNPEKGIYFNLPFPDMNRSVQADTTFQETDIITKLGASLRRSLELRVQHVREASDIPGPHQRGQEARIAILFSGGLDCTILARMVHDLLPRQQSIDLLNVAFENPRIHRNLTTDQSPYELCPDRITGRSSYAELSRICPERTWRFIEINVPYVETVARRPAILSLMHPHNTEMDLSISYALYFASRGTGITRNATGRAEPCVSSTPVLLSGLGADELFGGYQRHAVAFARQGYPGLIEELELDFNRLGKRNLGRDDRVISDAGKEVRFPYLDEDFIAFALELPVFAKCDFGNKQPDVSDDPKLLLEPAKRILRLLAWELGMKGVAMEKKRAIQFGARTAKMETGKTKGHQVLP